jgi:penicillin-binding protein 1A
MAKKGPTQQAKLSSPEKTRNFTRLFWILGTFPITIIISLLIVQSFSDLPSIEDLKDPQLSASIVYANDGQTELGRYWKVNRVVAHYDSISPFITDALISTEDERFFDHSGIDFKALARAIANAGSAGGASTITQQLAKQLFTLKQREDRANGEEESKPWFGSIGRKVNRLVEKVRENIISTRIEETFTKEEIITMYLNQFDFLYNAVGIANACKIYYNKTPQTVTKQEAAMLVGMCKNPTLFNPYTFTQKNYRGIIANNKGISPNDVANSDVAAAREKDSIRAWERRNQVLFQWLKNSNKGNDGLRVKLTQAEYDELKTKSIRSNFQQLNFKKGRATYFREAVRKELVDLLDEKDENGDYVIYKRNLEDPEDKSRPYNIYEDGLRIYTTVDYRMQVYAEEAVKRHLSQTLQPQFDQNNRGLRNYPFSNDIKEDEYKNIMNTAIKRSDRYYNMANAGFTEEQILEKFKEKIPIKVFTWDGEEERLMSPLDSIKYYKGMLQAGLLSIEPETGFVKAWVGGTDIDHFAYDHVRQGTRQVGSTMKPFVYATAMSMGVIKPCTKVENVRHCIKLYHDDGTYFKTWCPGGSGGEGGTVSIKKGLANSLNNIAAWTINHMGNNGPKILGNVLELMDIKLAKRDLTPSMALGSVDMSLYQLVAAQAMFVNHGLFNKPTTILRIEDRYGNEIYTNKFVTREVFNETYAYSIIDMMKEVCRSGTASSIRSGQAWANISYPTAGKTGTTQSNSDGWFIGLTPDLATGVWVGAEDRGVRFRSTNQGQGARTALPIYGYFMNKVYKDPKLKVSKEDFEKPDDFDESKVDCNENYSMVTREEEGDGNDEETSDEEATIENVDPELELP